MLFAEFFVKLTEAEYCFSDNLRDGCADSAKNPDLDYMAFARIEAIV